MTRLRWASAARIMIGVSSGAFSASMSSPINSGKSPPSGPSNTTPFDGSWRIAHLLPDFFDLLDNRHLARAKRRGYKQHWCSLPSVCVPDTDNICSADGVNYYIIASLES